MSLAKLLQELVTGFKNSAFCQQNGSHSVGTQDNFVSVLLAAPLIHGVCEGGTYSTGSRWAV